MTMASFIQRHPWMGLVVVVGFIVIPTPARAHVELLHPPARYASDLQKDDPCGHPMNPPGEAEPTVFEIGETITVEFDEFVDHPGHFRIALDPTGTDAFVKPQDFDDLYNSPEVLLDDIPDEKDGGLYSVEVTLPDVQCDPCTLQLIQVMTDDGAFGPGNDDLYFQCADIVIGPVMATTTDEPRPGSDDAIGDGDPGEGTSPNDSGIFTGGVDSSSGGSGATADSDTGDDGGCSCRARPTSPGGMSWLLVALWVRRRRPG